MRGLLDTYFLVGVFCILKYKSLGVITIIKFKVISISRGRVHAKTKTRPVKVELKLENAIAVDECGNESSIFKAVFKSERKWDVFCRFCAREDVFSIGYETSRVRYRFWNTKNRCWEHKIFIPNFTVNETESGRVLFMVKAHTLGGANSVYKYRAIKKCNPSLKLIFYSLHGAVVSCENKQFLKDWAKDIGFKGTSQLKSSYFCDVPMNGMVERCEGQMIYVLNKEVN